MAAVEAGKEIAWMRNILSEFGYGVQEPSTLKMDNQSAITVSKNPEHHGCMKHLDLCLYWLRDKVEHGMINPDFILSYQVCSSTQGSVLQRTDGCSGLNVLFLSFSSSVKLLRQTC
jgi:hypothetical protein